MRVALIVPPFEEIYGDFKSLYRRGFLNPPIGLAYVAAGLENYGHEVIIIDAEAECLGNNEIFTKLKAWNPAIIGQSLVSPTFDISLKFSKALKAAFPDIPIIVGGAHVSIFQKSVLEENDVFDFGVIGDGEFAVPELVAAYEDTKNYDQVKGLIWRQGNSVIQNEFRLPETNLDIYPFPARHLLQNELYYRNIPYKGYVKAAAVMSTRGCPYNCIYCAVKRIPNGTTVRFRSPDNVLAEIEQLVSEGIHHISFNDDCLTFKRENIMYLCNEIIRRKLEITWDGLSRADKVDKEMLELMRAAGCVRISFGIESGNDDILKVLNKQERLEHIAHGIKLARRAGIVTRGSVIIGSPYETIKEVEDTFKFINSLEELDQVVINIMQPYPGTKVRDMVLNGEGGTRLLRTDFATLHRLGGVTMEVNDLTAEKLLYLQKKGMRGFYFRPGTIIRQAMINHPKALILDGIAALKSLL